MSSGRCLDCRWYGWRVMRGVGGGWCARQGFPTGPLATCPAFADLTAYLDRRHP